MDAQGMHSRIEELLAHREWVRQLARRLVADESRADDLEQETWLRALSHPPRHSTALRAWLGRVVRSVWIDTHRSESKRSLRELAATRPEPARARDVVAEADAHRRVVLAVYEIAEPYRTTLLLRYFEGLSVREVGAEMGVSADTVKTRLRRAIETMRERLDRECEGDRSAWHAALLPIALSTGGIAMKTSHATAAVATVLLLLGGTVWWATRDGAAPPGGAGTETATVSRAEISAPRDPSAPQPGPPTSRPERRPRAEPPEPTPAPEAAPPTPSAPPPTPPAVPPVVTPPTPQPGTGAPADARIATSKSLGSSGEVGAGSLRIVLTDIGDRPLDTVKLQVYCGIGRPDVRTDDVPLGANGEAEARGLVPGDAAVWLRAGSLFRSVMTQVVAGELTEIRIRFPRGATVTGVVRHVTKGPVGDAELTIGKTRQVSGSRPWAHDTLGANTDAEGRFRFEDVPIGSHVVSVSSQSAGYTPAARDPIVVTGPGEVVQDIVVGRVAIEGVVRDASTKRPVAGARLSISTGTAAFADTDSRGAYRMSDVPPGQYKVQVRHDGHVLSWFDVAVADGDSPTHRDFDLPPAAILELHLTDANGQPYVGGFLLGHEVRGSGTGAARSGPFFTDENGVLRHEWIGAGSVSLTIWAQQGYAQWGAADADLVAGTNVVTIVVRPPVTSPDPTKGLLVGRVTDARSGRPVPGARVRSQASGSTAVTDRDGNYRLEGLILGLASARDLWVSKDGYGSLFTTSEPLVPGKPVTFHIALEPASTLRLRLSGPDGQPLVGQFVLSLKPKEAGKGTRVGTGITTDPDGVAIYRQILPGSYTITVSAKDVGRASADLDVGETEATLDLVLR